MENKVIGTKVCEACGGKGKRDIMMKLIIYMEPIPKARARTVNVNGKVMSFTPKATQEAESTIRLEIMAHAAHPCVFGAGVPLSVDMIFVVTRPPSTPKKRIYPVVRPDGDNYQKLVFDACNGYLWADDSQVCEWRGRKVYGQPPRIEIEVSPLT